MNQNSHSQRETKYDAVIIGAGVIGCAIARELSRYRLSIGLLDKASDVAEGTTKANSAIVHAGYDAKPGSEKARTNVLGNAMFADYCRELHVPFRRNTSLVVAFSDDDPSGLEPLLERGRQNEVPGLSLLSQRQLRQREPRLGPAAKAALLAETGGICSPYDLCIALAAQAVRNGVDLRLDCQVTHLARQGDEFLLQTSRGPVRSRILINAAGVFADDIHNALSPEKIKIIPRRGEYWLMDKAVGRPFDATIFQMPTAMGKGILVTPTVEDTLILGPTAADISDKSDVATTAEKLAEILDVAAKTWPDIPRHLFITSFAGLRAHSSGGDFILGESRRVPGLIEAAGIESPGLTAAPAIGKELADLAAKVLSAHPKSTHVSAWKPAPSFRTMSDEQRQEAIAKDPEYGQILCRCEQVSAAEIRAAIQRPAGATTLDGIKRRTRAGMGRCQGGFCSPKVIAMLSEELKVSPLAITKFGGQSYILSGRVGKQEAGGEGQ